MPASRPEAEKEPAASARELVTRVPPVEKSMTGEAGTSPVTEMSWPAMRSDAVGLEGDSTAADSVLKSKRATSERGSTTWLELAVIVKSDSENCTSTPSERSNRIVLPDAVVTTTER